jgi:hypothetical protein
VIAAPVDEPTTGYLAAIKLAFAARTSQSCPCRKPNSAGK